MFRRWTRRERSLYQVALGSFLTFGSIFAVVGQGPDALLITGLGIALLTVGLVNRARWKAQQAAPPKDPTA
jgi:hypothetical protein